MASTWIAYTELAWTEDLLAVPASYEDEVKVYVDLINRTASHPPRTLLHLGSGAGGCDHIFKRYFEVTGVDISRGMLDKARVAHPDIEYIEDDMHTVRLNRQFDCVAVPDSIDYMASEDDLRLQRSCVAFTIGLIHTCSKDATPFGVAKKGCVHISRGSGVPQPWALLWYPVGMLSEKERRILLLPPFTKRCGQ